MAPPKPSTPAVTNKQLMDLLLAALRAAPRIRISISIHLDQSVSITQEGHHNIIQQGAHNRQAYPLP